MLSYDASVSIVVDIRIFSMYLNRIPTLQNPFNSSDGMA